ncbi:subtilisin-like protein [Hysterangium stoloniferum]|nr:subtilisin-like protein [Hysterangium stoloniferum]
MLLMVRTSPLSDREAFQVKHSWAAVPNGWEVHGDAPESHMINLRIGLKEGNIDDVIRHLYEVSDPAHPRYGQHLSKEEVDKLVAPHSETLDAVDSWLRTHDIEPSSCGRTTAGDWMHLSVPLSKAESMFNTKYQVFRHKESGEYTVRTLEWSLPRSVHSHIDVVEPTTMFGRLKKMKATSFLQPPVKDEGPDEFSGLAVPPTTCNTKITPSCLRTLYNTINYVPAATNVNKLGVAGYLGEFANNADLQTFFQKFRTDAVGGTFTTVQVNGGGNNQNQPGVEANLDIQYTEGMSFPTPNIYFSTGGSPPFIPDSNTPTNTNEPYLDWLNFILNQTTVPQTFTTSYGDDEQTVPEDFAVRVCNGFAQLGARGSSIMFSSGDDGVGAGDCLTNDGQNIERFQPNFPASCPFVTTVGATTRTNPETAIGFSGGGFSNFFAQPSYQTAAVSTYLTALGATNKGLFNVSGRAYPDVAAQGEGFQVIVRGITESVAGTSASSPTFAGVIALLNDFRLANGKPSLGFLNPLIYTIPSGFNDITTGDNPGCGTNGFPARAGWDPVTGLGTPDFLKLQALV